MSNCANCGKPLVEEMRFCPYCGQPVSSEEMERFEPTKGEIVGAVASPARLPGREDDYAVAFTAERLIFARIGRASPDTAKDELRHAGIFLPGSSSAVNVSRFYEMTPAQVLDEHKDNFSLDNSEVEGVRLAYETENGGRYVITIRSAEGEVVFTLPYDRYYRDLLFRQFEGRVTW